MKFYKLVKHDIVNGIWHRAYGYIGAFVLSFIFFLDFYIKVHYYYYEGNVASGEQVTIVNYLFYFFQGKEPFIPTQEDAFIIPAVWMLIFLCVTFFTLEYPFHSLNGHGIQIIIRSGKRKLWWLSKCVWVMAETLTYFAVLYLTLLLLCLITGIEISFHYAKDINNDVLGLAFSISPSQKDLLLLLVILPIMTSLALNMLQLCLGLFLKRIYSFTISAVLLLASAYYQSPALIGNFAMVKRSILSNPEGVTGWQGIIITGVLIVLSAIVGFLYIGKYEIINKE